jgi:hypothetical protein
LKRLLAEAALDKAALKEPVEGKWSRPRNGDGPWNTSKIADSVSVGPAGWWV